MNEVAQLSALASRLADLYPRYFSLEGESRSIVGETETIKVAWQLERLLNPEAIRFGNPRRGRWGSPKTVVDAIVGVRDAVDPIYRHQGWEELCVLTEQEAWKGFESRRTVKTEPKVILKLAKNLKQAVALLRAAAVDAFHVTADEWEALEKSLTQPPKKESAIELRDKWIYTLCMEGVPFKKIIAGLRAHPSKWPMIRSVQGVKRAAEDHAKRLRLPLPRKRQRGRPAKKK
jgi:hypothetical protein